jgi:phytanoyl-CoA hydroxylase
MKSLKLPSPHGPGIDVPVDVDDASDPYLALKSGDAVRDYYARHGYVVIRGLIPPDLCDEARRAFDREVKPFDGYIYRQASAVPETNKFTPNGFVINSILNIQDLDRGRFPTFRETGLAVITNPRLHEAFRTLLEDETKVVQSMYFEGNPVTWAHQDTYYLDSEDLGRMAGAWIAVEDIHPGAGRFYVYPGSHRIDMQKNGGDFDIAFNHDRYKQLVIDVVTRHGLECRAPAMRKGDVLFWSSKTIHGSLPTTHAQYSRASFTAHAIPRSRDFLQYQSRRKPLRLRDINGIPVHCPKDQNEALNRAVLFIETTFPGLFNAAKKAAIKLVTH